MKDDGRAPVGHGAWRRPVLAMGYVFSSAFLKKKLFG